MTLISKLSTKITLLNKSFLNKTTIRCLANPSAQEKVVYKRDKPHLNIGTI